jgi:putative chitinase
MIFSAEEWGRILFKSGCRPATATKWGPVFAATVKESTFSAGLADLVDFLATILHESQYFEFMKENGNYSASRIRELGGKSRPGSRWRSMVPMADRLANNPTAFFEAAYGGRMGNDLPGDGAKYPGRGPLGITGKDNYRWLGDYAGQDLVDNPTLLEQPYFSLELCIAWWEGKIPDNKLGDERSIRKIVNGGDFGIEAIRELLVKVKEAIHAEVS